MRSVNNLLLILVLLLGACESGVEQQQRRTGETPQAEVLIVAVGDSLTAGLGVEAEHSYPYLLEARLKSAGHDVRVVNAGVSAETSTGTLARLDWVLTMKPDIVILETGANDGLRGTDPQLLEDNLREILGRLREERVVTVLAGMQMVWNLGPLYVAQFNSIYPRLAEEFGLIFMPFFLEGVAMQAGLNQDDGLHPNHAGYQRITEQLFPYVLQALEEGAQ